MEKLTKAEEAVFLALYKLGGKMLKTKDILQHLESEGYTWKFQTVSTFLTSLVRKGYTEISSKSGRRYYYSVCISIEEYREFKLNEFVDFWYNGNLLAFATDAIK